PARITRRSPVQFPKGAWHTIGDVRVLHHTDQTSEAGCVVAERRGEGVVNDVEIASVRRNRRCRIKATVGRRATYDYRSRPSGTTIAGMAEQHLFMVETKATVRPGIDDLVGSANARRGAVGDIQGRRGGQVAPCAGDAILDAFGIDGVHVV